MGLLTLMGLERLETRSGPVTEPSPGVLPPARTAAGVSLDTALTLPAVYRAISILTGAVSQLSLKVYRGGEEVEPLPALVRSPDVDQTLSQFLKRTMVGLAGTGNAYWLILRRTDSTVVGLQVLDPHRVRIVYDKGRKTYQYGETTYLAPQIRHLRLLEVPGHAEGLGPVQAARSGLSAALDLSTYADGWFQSATVPTGVLSSQMQLDPEVVKLYQTAWADMVQNGKTAVLGQGLKYEPIILKPADAQFLESQQFSVTTVARLFGIPATYMLAEVPGGQSLTYTNAQQVDVTFVKHTLMTYLVEIEDALTALLVRGQSAKFDLSGFLRPDARAQAEVHKTYLEFGVMTADEVRTDLGIPGAAPGPARVPAPAPPATPEVIA